MTTFNLVDEPWIPCALADGSRVELGLADTLARAQEVDSLFHPSPLVTAALHRLLLAILHRNFGPESAAAWEGLWRGGRWDDRVLDCYFDSWRQRFGLFDGSRPFYQAPDLDFQYAGPISKLRHDLASGNNPTLFDHSVDAAAEAMTPAEAARHLVAHQAFALGGTVSLERGQDPRLYKSADAAPLAKGAVCLVRGANLFQTLMLNLHQYSPDDAEPFAVHGEDRPAWERDEPPRAEDRAPGGYLDLLTWQSRRIRLQPAVKRAGEIAVDHCVIMKGNQFPSGFSRHGKETMLAFIRSLEAREGQDPWPAVAFRPERAVWRDSLALVQSLSGVRSRPKTIDWLHDLVAAGIIERSRTLAIDLLGLATDRAKVFLWRHERLPLPLAYLEDDALVDGLGHALNAAEQVAAALP